MAKQTFTAGQILTAAQVTALQTNTYNQTVSAKTASYTLVAADVGTTITMTSASATTVTVNTSLFVAGDTLRVTNLGAGVCTITAGTCTVAGQNADLLKLSTNASGILYFTSASAAIWLASNPGKTTSYTPNWTFSGNAITIGNGTNTGNYTVEGAYINVEALAIWGSTTTAAGAGALYFSLPSGYYPVLTSTAYAPLGTASLFNSSVARFVTNCYNDTQFNAGYVAFASTMAYQISVVSNSSPYTQIATSNVVQANLRYRWSTT